MNWDDISNIMVTILKALPAGLELYKYVKDQFTTLSTKKIGQTHEPVDIQQLQSNEKKLAEFLKQASYSDPKLVGEYESFIKEARNLLLDFLAKKFTVPNLRETYFRLGYDYDEFVENGKRAKVMALIEVLESEHHLPELVEIIIKVRPDLNK